MKFKKYIAALLAAITLLFSGCDINELLQEVLPEFPTDSNSQSTDKENKPSAPLHKEEGHIHSKESEMLTLCVDWEAVTYDEKTATVAITVDIHCFGISTGKHELTVTVNGETQTVTTPIIVSQKNYEKTFPFVDLTFEVDLTKSPVNTLDICATWDYVGVYNGQEINGMVAAAKIQFPGGEIIPNEDTSDSSDSADTTDAEAPDRDPDAPLYRESGKIASEQSKWLILFANWEAVSKDGKTATVTVTPEIECRKLKTEKHKLTITVNGQSVYYETNQINHGTDEKITYTLASKEFEIELNQDAPTLLSISAVWTFNDTDGYSQEIIEELTAEITVTFPGGEEVEPEAKEQSNEPDPQDESID